MTENESQTEDFYDFDAAVGELEDRWEEFKFGGEMFKVNLNVEGGHLLLWMEKANKVEGIPELLRVFLDDEDYERLLNAKDKHGVGLGWPYYEALATWLAEKLGDSGN